MRVNVLCSREDAGFHVDSLELYSARQRAQYVTMAAHELAVEEQVIKRDLGSVLLKLEELQDKKLKPAGDDKSARSELSDEEREAAMALLRDPKLLDRILDDFERCGVVGETTNKLVGYLAATSRLLDEPLAVVIQSCSAAGKSSLMEAVLAEKGRIRIGPVQRRTADGEFKVLPLRIPAETVTKLDEARVRLGLKSRMALIRRALQAYLDQAGEQDVAGLFAVGDPAE
jgi:hypothetical protein